VSGSGAVSVGLLEQFDTIMHNKGSSHGDGRIFRCAEHSVCLHDVFGFGLTHGYTSACSDSHTSILCMWRWQRWRGKAGRRYSRRRLNPSCIGERVWSTHQAEFSASRRGGGVDVFDSMPSSARSATTRALEENGAQYEEMSPLDLHRRFPQVSCMSARRLTQSHGLYQFSIQDPMCAIFQPDAAVLFADKCRAALAHSAEVHGARIHTDTRVTMLQPHAGGVTVHSSKGVFEARKLALCAGPWTSTCTRTHGGHRSYASPQTTF
jgi:glycine/D-amino acid oxidase-like deaminating enzyme